MPSPFNIKKTTQVGRNGFDLSQRHLFNAACGALYPVVTEETLPGDNVRIRLNSFTRLRPLFTPAFARFKEYFDVYWCPSDVLWPYFNSLVVNNNEPQVLPSKGTALPSQVPNTLIGALAAHLLDPSNVATDVDDMGVWNGSGFSILCDLLGYGNADGLASQAQGSSDMLVSLMPFALYQSIYQNYYRNPQWERRDPLAYNLHRMWNNVSGNTQSISDLSMQMFRLRYANWQKDYFMGLYPTQQFGDVSVVSGASTGVTIGSSISGTTNSRPLAVDGSGLLGARSASSSAVTNKAVINSEFSIVDLRRAQALQRLKEVTMTNGSSMYQQVKAHFGFELPEGRKNVPEFIGSWDNVITISDVVSSAGTSENSLGDLAGRGAAASDPNKVIEFTAKDFGYYMVIYHVQPYLDYAAVGTRRMNTKLESGDFFIPEFDRIGFGSIDVRELCNVGDMQLPLDLVMGYSSRYLDLKASYDRVHGSYIKDSGDFSAWSVKLGETYLSNYFTNHGQGIDYTFFKIPPYITDRVFQVSFDPEDLESTSPFQVCPAFDIKKVSNMSVDSLPY